MDKFNSDLSLWPYVAVALSRARPVERTFPRHEDRLCPDPNVGESCQDDRRRKDRHQGDGTKREKRVVLRPLTSSDSSVSARPRGAR